MSIEERMKDWRSLLVMGGALKAGLIDLLASQPLSAAALAQQLGSNEHAISVLAEALVSLDCLERGNGTYRLTDEARRSFVDEGNPNFLRHGLMHQYRMVGRWYRLPEVIGGGHAPSFSSGPAASTADFIGAMALGAANSASPVADLCLQRWPAAQTMLDVGGGPGVHAQAFAKRGLAATLFDLPEVIDLARGKGLDRQGITLIGGDFLQAVPPGPYDIALLSSICHIYGAAKNTALFRRLAKSLSPQGGIAIVDFVRGISPAAPLFGINMLVSTEDGGTWTEAEYRDWLTAAGYSDIQLTNVGGLSRQLITARPGGS